MTTIKQMRAIVNEVFEELEKEISQQSNRRKAPWKDYKGNDIYEGDRIEHPEGQDGGYVFFIPYFKRLQDQWRVAYDERDYVNGSISRLCLQIGDKGQAVVVKEDAK